MAESTGIPRRTMVLLIVLGVVAVWAVVWHLGRSGTGPAAGRDERVEYASRRVPELAPLGVDSASTSIEGSGRNPFAFGAPPTPTPNLTPKPTPKPRPTRKPRPTPTPRIIEYNGKRLPPPPPFDRTYLGFLGPDRLPIAVLRRDQEIEIAPLGAHLENKQGKDTFIVRAVEYDSVVIGFVGYPEKEIQRVPLAEK